MIRAVLFDNDGVLSKWTVPRPAMHKLAKDLTSHGIKVGMLSNVARSHAWVYRLWKSYEGFEVLLLSYKEKMSKPNPKFYELAVEKLGVKPQEILFIDNRKGHLEPAKKLGLKTLHSTSAKQVLRDTKEFIEKENKIKL